MEYKVRERESKVGMASGPEGKTTEASIDGGNERKQAEMTITVDEEVMDDDFTDASLAHYREWLKSASGKTSVSVGKKQAMGRQQTKRRPSGQTTEVDRRISKKHNTGRCKATSSHRSGVIGKTRLSGDRHKSKCKVEGADDSSYAKGMTVGFELFRSFAKRCVRSHVWDTVDMNALMEEESGGKSLI